MYRRLLARPLSLTVGCARLARCRVLASPLRTLCAVDDGRRWRGSSALLLAAAGLVALEALAVLATGVSVALAGSMSRLVLDITTVAFFVLYAGGLLICAGNILRGAQWARAPIVLAQLIQLAVAWGFRGGETTRYAVLLALTAGAVLVLVLHPSVTATLTDDEDEDAA